MTLEAEEEEVNVALGTFVVNKLNANILFNLAESYTFILSKFCK